MCTKKTPTTEDARAFVDALYSIFPTRGYLVLFLFGLLVAAMFYSHRKDDRKHGLLQFTKPVSPKDFILSRVVVIDEKTPPNTNKLQVTPYESPQNLQMIRQYSVTPISPLISEVSGIYAGLIRVEAKCEQIYNGQYKVALGNHGHLSLKGKQWQALVALHKTLLHEHHDFFLASQHPSASESLKTLPVKYRMPGRMWKHAIYQLLHLLHLGLPGSEEFMSGFLNFSYTMLTLLLETVPTFQHIWTDYLGELARYGAIICDNHEWKYIARQWHGTKTDHTASLDISDLFRIIPHERIIPDEIVTPPISPNSQKPAQPRSHFRPFSVSLVGDKLEYKALSSTDNVDGPTNLELYLSVNSESLHAEEEDEWNENFDEIHDFFNKIVKNEKCAMMENGRLSGHPAPYAIVWVDTNAINLEHLEKVAPENDWFKQSKFQLLFLPGGPEYM